MHRSDVMLLLISDRSLNKRETKGGCFVPVLFMFFRFPSEQQLLLSVRN